ncbi:hypothetical protein AAE021_13055 [Arthrobacter citreus]|uniref:Uncharacterized protein n=1 Tax=Arthrobacter citreus TaxID=1670 RepID=A0ABZ2ZSE7_9MICC
MSSVDLSGTAHLPAASELLAGAASLVKYSSRAGESISRARDHWSRLSETYAAPEQHLVHQALDEPHAAGHSALDAACRVAKALETFATAAADISRRRLELQEAVEELRGKDGQDAIPSVNVSGSGSGSDTGMTFAETLLQARADQLAQELVTAEDRCIAVLNQCSGRS